jgi:hypothetical protein
MVQNDQSKHERRGLPAGLGVSTLALLVPPLAMAAAVAFFAYYPSEHAAPKREEPRTVAVADSTIAKTQPPVVKAETTIAKTVAPRPEPGQSFVLSGAEQKFSGRPPDVAPPGATDPRATKEDRSDSTPLPGTKDLDRIGTTDVATHFGPAVVSVVRVSKAPAPPEVAALETPPLEETSPALTAPAARAYVPRRVFHARARTVRHDSARHDGARHEGARRDSARHDARAVHVAAKHQPAHPRAPSGTVRARTHRG